MNAIFESDTASKVVSLFAMYMCFMLAYSAYLATSLVPFNLSTEALAQAALLLRVSMVESRQRVTESAFRRTRFPLAKVVLTTTAMYVAAIYKCNSEFDAVSFLPTRKSRRRRERL